MENTGTFISSLHTHVRSLNDADIPARALCDRILEMGGTSCAITDHGSLTAIEDYRRVFKEKGLKLIPGCELYVDGGMLGREHLVVLAKNDKGYQGISKMVTLANRHLDKDCPVITFNEICSVMKMYKDDIIALSACMQGVICANFLTNGTVSKKIEAVRAKQKKYISPQGTDYADAKKVFGEASAKAERATLLRDTLHKTAKQTFGKREKAAAKIEKTDPERAAAIIKQINIDKSEAEAAAIQLSSAQEELKHAKREKTAAEKALKEIASSIEKWFLLEEEIAKLSSNLVTEEKMIEDAKTNATSMLKVFGEGNFYIELQYHGIPAEKECFTKAAQVAEELNIPVVATNDVHILNNTKDDRLKRQVLRSMRFKKWEPENVGDEELYLKNNKELKEALVKILPEETVDEAIKNIGIIADKCNVEFKTGTHYPKFAKDGQNSNELLEKAVEEGVKTKFPEGLSPEYEARLKRELQVIESMGYADYHLIVKDFLEYGRLLGALPTEKIDEAPLTIDGLRQYIKDNGWKNSGFMIGPGRGSAAGSLVCNVLGITNLDPLKYDLLFERFLNPERVSMPDIDSDIGNGVRPKVIEYVQNKYGKDAVCGILTITTQQPRGAVAIAAKYYGLMKTGEGMLSLGEKINKSIPEAPTISFGTTVNKAGDPDEDGCYTLIDYLKKTFSENADALEILRWATIIEGAVTSYSAHAAGIVISDNSDISDYLPLRMNDNLNIMTTQCDMIEVEDAGLLKFDFLGLKTLDIITETMRLVEKNTGVVIDPLKIDLADNNVYRDIFQKARTGSVFQFSSVGMKNMLKRFLPEKFEDLIILNSMFRPGPLQYLDDVCDVKNGKKEISFLCPELEPILGKTYGAIVYQEQVMQIFRDLAGYSLGGADEVRRYMSKKKADKLAHEKEAFINGDPERGIKGCVNNGIAAKVAEELFDQMTDFAGYAFNKSHAAAYSFNAYITAWLKEYYPTEFLACALNWANDKNEIAQLLRDASSFGIRISPPDVNVSIKGFTGRDNNIRYGLSSVEGVKDHADTILAERSKNGEFRSLTDFCIRCRTNRKVTKNLINAGAFDNLSSYNRRQMADVADQIPQYLQKIKDKDVFIKTAEAVMPVIETTEEEIIRIQEENGLKVAFDKPKRRETVEKQIENARAAKSELINALHNIPVQRLTEDVTERLNTERQLLGAYVTGSPLDIYPEPSELKVKPISEIEEFTSKLYGVVTDIEIKKRKRDGAAMGFFRVEDRTGSVEAICFAEAFAEYGSLLKDGAVLMLTGKCEARTEEDGDVTYKFLVRTVSAVQTKMREVFVLTVDNLDAYHREEASLSSAYKADGGIPLRIFNRADSKFYRARFAVSRSIFDRPDVDRMFVK